uniref:Uncharacterized protein n=1 Tax=Setaria viridis TaxID=4556 RepID=A0A4V6D4H3_SETVI|nr:hypothetical protein SEVIR_7G241400v2 [Setaria viridis]
MTSWSAASEAEVTVALASSERTTSRKGRSTAGGEEAAGESLSLTVPGASAPSPTPVPPLPATACSSSPTLFPRPPPQPPTAPRSPPSASILISSALLPLRLPSLRLLHLDLAVLAGCLLPVPPLPDQRRCLSIVPSQPPPPRDRPPPRAERRCSPCRWLCVLLRRRHVEGPADVMIIIAAYRQLHLSLLRWSLGGTDGAT